MKASVLSMALQMSSEASSDFNREAAARVITTTRTERCFGSIPEELHRKEVGTFDFGRRGPVRLFSNRCTARQRWVGGLAYDPKLRRLFVSHREPMRP